MDTHTIFFAVIAILAPLIMIGLLRALFSFRFPNRNICGAILIDPANDLTIANGTLPKSQTNNTGGFVADLSNFIGKVALRVLIGTKTAGDSDGAITLRATTSTTNNISNATNYGSSTVATTNNSTNSGSISVDTRDANRYLFYGVTVTGTNTPAYPIGVLVIGQKKVQ